MSISYRKTAKGEWVAFGPAAEFPALRPGVNPEITVSKRDGTVKTERVTDLGKIFKVDGREMRYGYLAPQARASAPRSTRSQAPMCDECGERRAVTTARDLSGISGQVCGICARSGALSFA